MRNVPYFVRPCNPMQHKVCPISVDIEVPLQSSKETKNKTEAQNKGGNVRDSPSHHQTC